MGYSKNQRTNLKTMYIQYTLYTLYPAIYYITYLSITIYRI